MILNPFGCCEISRGEDLAQRFPRSFRNKMRGRKYSWKLVEGNGVIVLEPTLSQHPSFTPEVNVRVGFPVVFQVTRRPARATQRVRINNCSAGRSNRRRSKVMQGGARSQQRQHAVKTFNKLCCDCGQARRCYRNDADSCTVSKRSDWNYLRGKERAKNKFHGNVNFDTSKNSTEQSRGDTSFGKNTSSTVLERPYRE